MGLAGQFAANSRFNVSEYECPGAGGRLRHRGQPRFPPDQPSMARAAITRASMRDFPAPPEGVAELRVFDTHLPGFIAERRRTGTTFYLRYKDQRGRSREVKLGRLGDVTVDQARQRAEHLRATVSLGADPVAERAKRRAVPLLANSARDRYLSAAETQALVRALDGDPDQDAAAALALLVVTGARKSEVLLAT